MTRAAPVFALSRALTPPRLRPYKTELCIIGSGAAAHTAAIYSARSALHPIMFEGFEHGGNQPAGTFDVFHSSARVSLLHNRHSPSQGGMLAHLYHVPDFPGYPDGIEGSHLMELMRVQSRKRGCSILPQNVISGLSRPSLTLFLLVGLWLLPASHAQCTTVDFSQHPFVVKSEESAVEADAVIVASGKLSVIHRQHC